MAHSPRIIALNLKLAEPTLDRIRKLAPEHQLIQVAELRQNWPLLARAEILLSHTFPQDQLRDNAQLRWIQTAGAGVEWLLTPEIRTRRELVITNASGVHAQPIAEHSFGFMLMFARQLHLARSRQAQAEWLPPKQEALSSLAGATLGILGVGAIGERIAQLGAAFGMRVIGLRRGGEPVPGVERMYAPDQLHALLSESDYILNALPLTADTRGLLDDAAFAAMRPHAFLVNIGRGQTIQREALLRALTERRIGGVGLDVTEPEPLPSNDPLWRFDNAIITPHYAGGRPDYVAQVAEIFLGNLERYLAGRPLVNVVDKAAGY